MIYFFTKIKSKGFTLIELLVVVAVFALLANIIFVNIQKARERARISNSLQFEASAHRLLGADNLGWWKFDGDYRDISGYNNHGSCTSCPVPADGVPGKEGGALNFDGTDIISIPHSEMLSNKVFGESTVFTLGAWVYPRSWINWTGIINKARGGCWSHSTNGMWAYNGGFTCVMGANTHTCNPSGSIIRITYRPPLNTWNYVVCTGDGTRLRMFVNGNEIGNGRNIVDLTYERSSNTAPITIGRRCVGCQTFHGIIDDVRIYSRALTTQEVQTLYTQTKDKFLTMENIKN